VGKTSLGESIARATGDATLLACRSAACATRRKSADTGAPISLEGKIIQSIRRATSSNPLFLLGGVDKMGEDFRGDPSSGLVEVLDLEQNHAFNDHYLEVSTISPT
jgi:ATP-dependent Lon protease